MVFRGCCSASWTSVRLCRCIDTSVWRAWRCRCRWDCTVALVLGHGSRSRVDVGVPRGTGQVYGGLLWRWDREWFVDWLYLSLCIPSSPRLRRPSLPGAAEQVHAWSCSLAGLESNKASLRAFICHAVAVYYMAGRPIAFSAAYP